MRKIQTVWNRHRASRKQVTIRNVMILLILVTITAFSVRTYVNENSMEQAVKNWCTEYFFGQAEIYATCSYVDKELPEGEQDVTQIYIEKSDTAGKGYDGNVYLFCSRKNPLKWVTTGHVVMDEPASFEVFTEYGPEKRGKDLVWKGSLNSFPEFQDSNGGVTTLSQDKDGQQHLRVEVQYCMNLLEKAPATCVDFAVNLSDKTCEVKAFHITEEARQAAASSMTIYEWIGNLSPKRNGEFWLSDTRMVYIAETIYEKIYNNTYENAYKDPEEPA